RLNYLMAGGGPAGSAAIPVGQPANLVGKFRRLRNLKVRAQESQVHGETLEACRTRFEEATVFVDRLDQANIGLHAVRYRFGRNQEFDARAARRSVPDSL